MIPLSKRTGGEIICHGGACKPVLKWAQDQGVLNADGSATNSFKQKVKAMYRAKDEDDLSPQDLLAGHIVVGTNNQATVSIKLLVKAGLLDNTGSPTPKAERLLKEITDELTGVASDKKCGCKSKPTPKKTSIQVAKITDAVIKKLRDMPAPKSAAKPSAQAVINKLWGVK